jgi:hypothetical protein
MFVGTVKVKLSNPIKWEDREISVVELDFGKVNGAMIKECERETFGSGNMSGMVRPFSSEYCSCLASAISGIPQRTIEKMKFDDFEKVWQTVAAYVSYRNPQEFYNQFTEGDEDTDFTEPAETPDKEPKKEAEKEKTTTK